MRMRILLTTAFLLSLVVAAPGVAAEPHEVLASVPDSATVVVSINDMNAIDTKARKLMGDMKMIAISPIMMFRGTVLSIVDGMDESGSMAFAIMPFASPAEMNQRMAILLPTTDRAKLTQFIQPEPVEGEGDFLKVSIKSAGETTAYLGAKGKYSVISPSLDTVKAMQSAGGNMAGALSPAARAVVRRNDICVLLKPAALLAAGGADDQGMRMLAASLGLTLDELKKTQSAHFGVRLDEAGLVLEGGMTGAAAPGPVAEGSLLTGLPADRFILVWGMNGHTVRQSITARYGPMIDLAPQFVPERREAVKSAISAIGEGVRSVAASVSALPEGPDGLVAMTKVVQCEGPADELMRRFERLVTVLKEGAVSDPKMQAGLARLSYSRAVEQTSDGVAVDQLRVDLAGVEGPDPAALMRVLGRDGLCVRMAAVDGKFVVATIGGGLARMEQAIAVVRRGGAPLAEDPLIAGAAKRLQGSRTAEGYLMLDRGLALGRAIVKALDEKAPLPTMKEQAAPIAVGAFMAGDSSSWELMVPYATVLAIKDVASDAAAGFAGQAMGGQQ
jgi:hypothetical protein